MAISALILVAEADPFNLRLLSELCSSLGYDVATAADGGAVLDSMARQRPSLLLMDARLPVMDGLQVLRIIKADQNLAQVPVLLCTGEQDEQARRSGIELGAEDYVSKPYRSFEVQQRLRNVLRLQLARGGGDVREARRSKATLEIIDPGTGAGTSSQLHISLEYEFTRAVRYGHPLGCVVVRCDNQREIAEQGGVAESDAVLADLSLLLQGGIRNVDHIFRSGPDEFTLLLPETDVEGCRIVVDRLGLLLGEFEEREGSGGPGPRTRIASACYPERQASDGEGLWRSVADAIREPSSP
ncbi:MAG: response regulator [Myxococcales bacterium]|nr:response regulator [Myxococcales bacterium]